MLLGIICTLPKEYVLRSLSSESDFWLKCTTLGLKRIHSRRQHLDPPLNGSELAEDDGNKNVAFFQYFFPCLSAINIHAHPPPILTSSSAVSTPYITSTLWRVRCCPMQSLRLSGSEWVLPSELLVRVPSVSVRAEQNRYSRSPSVLMRLPQCTTLQMCAKLFLLSDLSRNTFGCIRLSDD